MAEAPQKILILFAHPALRKSRVHAHLLQQIEDLEHVTLHDLYEHYPDFHIDIKAEQELVEAHDVIVFQHPMYWYSTPAILKEWTDLVLQHNWAYGEEGEALKNKLFFNALSTGGAETAYCKDGRNRFSIRELLSPMEQTAFLCNMRFLPPYVIFSAHDLNEDQLRQEALHYRLFIEAIRDNTLSCTTYNEENTMHWTKIKEGNC